MTKYLLKVVDDNTSSKLISFYFTFPETTPALQVAIYTILNKTPLQLCSVNPLAHTAKVLAWSYHRQSILKLNPEICLSFSNVRLDVADDYFDNIVYTVSIQKELSKSMVLKCKCTQDSFGNLS